MYNRLVKDLLAEISSKDAVISAEHKKYEVSDSFSSIELYVSADSVSFKVFGDAYMTAMVKWLQIKLQAKESLDEISLEDLIAMFDLPEVKYRNAIQLMNLIEKINDRKAS